MRSSEGRQGRRAVIRARRWAWPFVAILACVYVAAPAYGEDSDQVRYYLDFRYGYPGSGLSTAHDAAGVSVGANLNRYLGIELSLDTYDVKVEDVSELEVLGFIPQVRLRYPLLGDRLVPYAIGGAGLAVTQANDARAKVFWQGGKTGVHAAGTLGGGIEYYIADNVAIGLEGKYLFSGDVAYTTTAHNNDINVSAALLSVGVRVLYPELHPEENAAAAREQTARFDLHFLTGAALLINLEPFTGIHATPEQPMLDSNFTPLFGFGMGADIGRYFGVELGVANYELKLRADDFGGIGEAAVFPVTVQPRVRYPLLDGRLEPFVAGGIGGEYAEINDRNAEGKSIMIKARDVTLIGTFGAGIDYFVMSNVSIGCAAQYTISRGHTLQLNEGPTLQGNLDSFFLSIGLRVFLFGV